MNIFLDSIGCRLNQSEIEIMALQFRKAGHTIVGDSAEADLVVINTCAVTSAAASDSRQKVRQAARNGAGEIIITGCWATLEPDKAAALPGVESVVLNDRKDVLVSERLQISPEIFDAEPMAREPLPGDHQRTRAFLKVQDGCDNFCTFCVTRIARGKGISRSIREVMEDVNQAVAGGVKEVVLSGVHLGSWGTDLEGDHHLRELITAILEDSDVPRLRLSSLEPWELGEDFFRLWEDPRLCTHIHLPLQSGSDAILRRMARKTTQKEFARIVQQARDVVPDMAVTTDMIVGFPGETDYDFDETVQFVREIGFAAGHVFNFSARPGTAAAKYKDQVPGPVRKRRSAVLRALFAESGHEYRSKFLGKSEQVLWESVEKIENSWQLSGLTSNYLRVLANAPINRWNQIDEVRLEHFSGEQLRGKIEKTAW